MVVVAEFVAGTDAEAALPSLEPDVTIRVMRDAGGAIAALHGMGALCFGDPERSGSGRRSGVLGGVRGGPRGRSG